MNTNEETSKYQTGVRVTHIPTGINGIIVRNYKLPGDICIVWGNGQASSYDEEFLDKYVRIVG